MRAADRAIGILAQLQLAESHGQRVEQQQPADERFAFADDELQRFRRLNRADDSRQHAEHAAFGARRHQARRRRLGIQAAIARAVGIAENVDLAFEAENRAVDIGLAEQHARVVHQIARGEIVRAVHDDVVVFQNVERVFAREVRFERINLNIGIQIAQAIAAAAIFGRPTSLVPKRIWRCRFVKSTVSKSTRPMRPTPAAAR